MVRVVSVGKSSQERGWFCAFQSLGPVGQSDASYLSLQWTLAKIQDSQSLGLCLFPQEDVCHVGMSEDWVLISKQEKSSVVSSGRHGTTK